MLRRLLPPLVLSLVAAAIPSGAAAAWLSTLTQAVKPETVSSGPLFLVTGHGWGHGVGMSQYGALGFAQHGWSYQKILAHFYPGTTLGAAPVAKVRVLLRAGASSVRITSDVPYKAKDADGQSYDVAAGTQTLGPKLKLKLANADKPKALAPSVTFQAGGQPLELDGRHYRGSLQLDVVGGKVRVINVVGLEPYLYGVVPSEMPFSWHAEALKAQAVAARSYGLAVRKTDSAFDLYADTRSQVYLGVDHEKAPTNEAVDATAGQVVLYDGAVATTYFFSTSGGRTASPADAWGVNGKTVPYLVSVPDPYDTISPYHSWGPVAYGGTKLARALHVPGAATDVETTLNGSGRVASLTVVTPRGHYAVAGPDVRKLLGLRSTWFSIGVLSLNAPSAPVVFGSTVQLDGIARGVGKVDLQQRVARTPWQTVRQATPKNGAVSIVTKPTVTTQYRLALKAAAAGPVRVAVAPRVRIGAPDPTTVRGTVRPRFAGVTVQIQRLDGTNWMRVSRTEVAADGRFEAHVQLVAGLYRARVAPGHGFVPGTSPPLKVVTG
jgi:stage II sporulation protein D